MSERSHPYGPVRVVRAGVLDFQHPRVVRIKGWEFDLGGRPLVKDWQREYWHHLHEAMREHAETRLERLANPGTELSAADGVQVMAERAYEALLERVMVPPPERRSLLEKLMFWRTA